MFKVHLFSRSACTDELLYVVKQLSAFIKTLVLLCLSSPCGLSTIVLRIRSLYSVHTAICSRNQFVG